MRALGRQILAGVLPDPYTVRTEEFINFFDYGYSAPKYGDEAPFAIHMEAAPSYFGESADLLRVAIQAAVVDPEDRLAANLIFLVDVSGSMSGEMPLPCTPKANDSTRFWSYSAS